MDPVNERQTRAVMLESISDVDIRYPILGFLFTGGSNLTYFVFNNDGFVLLHDEPPRSDIHLIFDRLQIWVFSLKSDLDNLNYKSAQIISNLWG